nr:leucyl aminopeptidase [uncultured Holophaga sp.]
MASVDINSQPGKDFAGDALIVPVFSGRERHRLPLAISKVARQVMDENDFKADYLEIVPLHHPNGVKETRWMVLVGLGEEEAVTPNKIRKAVGAAARSCLKKGWKQIGVVAPSTSTLEHDDVQAAVLEGALLADFDTGTFKGKPSPRTFDRLEVFTNGEDTRKARRRLAQIQAGVHACHLVRRLTNTPPSDLSPEVFAAMAAELASQRKVEIEVLDPESLAKDNFNGVLAVGGGSSQGPRVVRLNYRPKEKAKKHIVLVGKGVCFDSGGLSLKDAKSMETMKDDMTGAAIVLATVLACAELEAPVQVTGLLGLVENMPSGTAYKPGDVVRSRAGKTIEVMNTDAEGRIVLADLLDLASSLEADHIVDLATLTGACLVALGEGVSGVMGTDQRLIDRLMDSGAAVGEHLWQLPLVEEYAEGIRSQIADLKNTTGSRWGGAITAGLFLKEFVKIGSWAHVDLSSCWSSSDRDYRPQGGTGEGPRWLLEWIMN